MRAAEFVPRGELVSPKRLSPTRPVSASPGRVMGTARTGRGCEQVIPRVLEPREEGDVTRRKQVLLQFAQVPLKHLLDSCFLKWGDMKSDQGLIKSPPIHLATDTR